MLARAQRIITIAWLAAAVGWLAWYGGRGQFGLGVAGALAIAAIQAVVLGLEFALLPWINRGDPAPRAGLGTLLRAWWGEVCAATRVFGWQQPWRSQSEPDHLPVEARGRRGVVFVHGFVCNRGFWNPWLRRLRAQGVPFVAVNLEPVLGSIECYPPIINAAVQRLADATEMPPVIVAHSMGGLAVRVWLAEHGPGVHVHSVITIGSPHHGTWLARFGFVHNTREMRYRSDWIAALERRESRARRALFTCFYSHCDNIACPASTGALAGADNRHVDGAAHVQMAFRPEVFDALAARLKHCSAHRVASGPAPCSRTVP